MNEIDPAILVLLTAAANGGAMMLVNHTNISWLKEAVRDLRKEVHELRNNK